MSSKHVPSEDSQLAILASDASVHDKCVACQRLAYVAGPKSVPALAALLSDPKLAAPARSGLEAIEDPAASKALMDALPKLKGRLLAGVVNSLGVRREKAAVPVLQKFAADDASGVRNEALASLGLIATPEAAKSLGALVGMGDGKAAGHASLIAIERLRADGHVDAAGSLLKAVQGASLKDDAIAEAAKRL